MKRPWPRRSGILFLAVAAAATKTLDDISKAAPTYDWHAARQRVRDAMMHEVNTYSNATSARLAIRTALRDKQRAVWIVSGRILVHEDFLRKGGMRVHLRHCIHGGRKECPDVGFQKRGSGKEACALLAKLVT